ncbi:hypothetical protein ABZ410_08445 [Streptomyces cinnamoneus]|uniref:hypothetical protein n=1 Tax=Streptomyces cinnamoneus TaxID=53446 RepID=UPI0033F4F2CB
MILGSHTRPDTVSEIVGSVSRITPFQGGYPDLGLSLIFDGAITTRLTVQARNQDIARKFDILMPKNFPDTWLEAGVNLSSPEWSRGGAYGSTRASQQLSACIGPYGRDGMAVEVWTAEEYVLLPWVDFSGLGKDHAYSLLGGLVFGGRIREAGPGHQTLVRRAGADLRVVELGFGAQMLTGKAPQPDRGTGSSALTGQAASAL